ncbi:MAG: hypothetical protein ACOYIN_04410 [Christensenellales bacterium]
MAGAEVDGMMPEIKATKMKKRSMRTRILSFDGVSKAIDERLLPIRISPNAYNYAFRNGALKGDLGVVPARFPLLDYPIAEYQLPELPTQPKSAHFYSRFNRSACRRDDRIVIADHRGLLIQIPAFLNDQSWSTIAGVTVSGDTATVNYNYNGDDILLISSARGSTYFWDGGPSAALLPHAPAFSSLTRHYERVYGSISGNKNRVWYSSYLNPLDWDASGEGAGYIEFNDEGGEVLKVVSFLSYLFIFRQHEILRLKAFGDQSEFSLSKIFSAAGRIMADSITLCGDRIIFLADDGLFELDGNSTRKIVSEFKKTIAAKDTVSGCFLHGKYYLAAYVDYCDELQPYEPFAKGEDNNSIIEYDVATGSVCYMRGLDARKLLSVDYNIAARVLVIFRHYPLAPKLGTIYHEGRFMGYSAADTLHKHWESPESDLGYPGRKKVIKKIYFTAKGATDLTVCLDGKKTVYKNLSGDAEVRIDRPAEIIKFAFDSDCYNASVTAATVDFDLI